MYARMYVMYACAYMYGYVRVCSYLCEHHMDILALYGYTGTNCHTNVKHFYMLHIIYKCAPTAHVRRCLYEVLGVERNADDDAIKKVYPLSILRTLHH